MLWKTIRVSEQRPLVSVVCVAYNHERFIADALSSFLDQEADFSFEIIVHDDASSDGTDTIVRNFCERFPGRIRYIRQARNIYSQGALIFDAACSYARGEFIALCEGDDFWVRKDKLKLQVDFLRRNPECGVVFGDVNVLMEESGQLFRAHDRSRGYLPPVGDVRTTLLRYNPYKTCTALFRREAMDGYARHARKLHARMEDYVLWLHIAERHAFGYIPEVLATYRVLRSSASHFADIGGKIRFARSGYKVAVHFNRVMNFPLQKRVLRESYCFSVFMYCLHTRRFADAVRFVLPTPGFFGAVLASAWRGVSSMRRRLSDR